MTKKDYELIASVLQFCKPCRIAKPKGYEDRYITWLGIVETLANKLAEKNTKFNRAKFLKACGVEIVSHTISKNCELGRIGLDTSATYCYYHSKYHNIENKKM